MRCLPSSSCAVLRLALALVLTLGGASFLPGQAGGGGSFGGGGGGDGGIVYVSYWLVRALIELCIHHPLLGIPLTIGLIALCYYSGVTTRLGWQNRAIRRGRSAREAFDKNVSAQDLQAIEPGFNYGDFLDRVRSAFQQAQESWCQQDLQKLRAFVSDAIYERFSLQIEEQIQDGWRQGMGDVRLGRLSIIHYGADSHFVTLTVRIPFHAKICRLDKDTGARLSGSLLPKSDFVECWSFVRRVGAKTGEGPGLIEQRCPNCGAELKIEAAGTCGSCSSLIRSGEYDWVLVEITQATQWRGEDTSAVPGLLKARAQDPGLNVQHLEDRASVIFWRKVAADRARDPAALARVATVEFLRDYGDRLAREDDVYRFTGECAVGSVKTLGILTGAEWDQVVIQVCFDGRTCRRASDGAVTWSDSRRIQRALYVLTRRSGTATDIQRCTSSSHCLACGAPDAGSTDANCAYCGAVFNDGNGDWLLEDIAGPMRSRELRVAIEELGIDHAATASPAELGASTCDMLQWLVQVGLEDGKLDAEDQGVLRASADKWGLGEERIGEIIAAASGDEDQRVAPADRQQARAWVLGLIELTLADGRISKGEMRLITRACLSAGFLLQDAKQMVRDTRTRMAKQSQVAMRAARRGATA